MNQAITKKLFFTTSLRLIEIRLNEQSTEVMQLKTLSLNSCSSEISDGF